MTGENHFRSENGLLGNEPAGVPLPRNVYGRKRIFAGAGRRGACASTRLLPDYPEPAHSDILDFLFKPEFGAGFQHLKVGIGGGEYSTRGSEPSHELLADATSLRSGTVPGFDGSAWHSVKLSLSGSAIAATLDGGQLVSLTDATRGSGRAGFASGYNPNLFDDLIVEPVGANGTTPTTALGKDFRIRGAGRKTKSVYECKRREGRETRFHLPISGNSHATSGRAIHRFSGFPRIFAAHSPDRFHGKAVSDRFPSVLTINRFTPYILRKGSGRSPPRTSVQTPKGPCRKAERAIRTNPERVGRAPSRTPVRYDPIGGARAFVAM